MRLRLARPSKLAPVDAPGEKPVSAEERKVTTVKALQIFAFVAMFIYGDGVVVSHLIFSEYGRAACHRAGGIVGRIWCPESVDTEGFRGHFVKALGWPVHVLRTAAAPAENYEKAVTASKRGDDAQFAQLSGAYARALVSEVQRLLNTLGYKIGNADGIIGMRTRASISEFQLRDGMKASGEVTHELVIRLQDNVRRENSKPREFVKQ